MNNELINTYINNYFNDIINDFNSKQQNILNSNSLPETYFNIAELFCNTIQQRELQSKLLQQELKHEFFANSDIKFNCNSFDFINGNLSISFPTSCTKRIYINYKPTVNIPYQHKLPDKEFIQLYHLYKPLTDKFTLKQFKKFSDFTYKWCNGNFIIQIIKYIHCFRKYRKGDYKHIIADYESKVNKYYSTIDEYNKCKELRNTEMLKMKKYVDDIIKTDLQQFVDEGYVISINGIDLCDEYNQTYKYSKTKDAFYKEWIIE